MFVAGAEGAGVNMLGGGRAGWDEHGHFSNCADLRFKDRTQITSAMASNPVRPSLLQSAHAGSTFRLPECSTTIF